MTTRMEKAKKGKIFVVSAPSGCGKSSIINAIMAEGEVPLRFSVSATNRSPREGEKDGVHYHFISTEEFEKAIADDRFVEWEEVYPGRYYGTLKDEVRRALDRGENIVLDIDVKGAMNVKKQFGDEALTLFVLPPSVDELRRRLEARGTDAEDVIDERVSKAEYEISFAGCLDRRIVNDSLEDAVSETKKILIEFLNG